MGDTTQALKYYEFWHSEFLQFLYLMDNSEEGFLN